jgi:hypothetical protein
MDANPSVRCIIDPVGTVEFGDDFWLGIFVAGVNDTLGVASTPQVHQAAGIINLELAQVDFGSGISRSGKITGELDILKALVKNNGLFPGINDKVRTPVQWALVRNTLKV